MPAVEYRRGELVFSPGDACESVMYIHRGGVKVSVVSPSGREAVVGVLGPGDFLGEGCLAGEATHMQRATTMTRSTIVVVAKDDMIRLLRRRPVSHRLLSHVLVRHIAMEQAIIDQFCSSTEKRLARTLLLLAHYGTGEMPPRIVGSVSEETLAGTVGTTCARVSALMREFRRKGFIEYKRGLLINGSLLSVVLDE
jgi:CRP/FNR family transcriptional regulator, cyclic AMP receptor protein